MQKKRRASGQNSIAYCWHNTHLHMRQMSFAGKIDHLADVVFRWRINSACCCASIGTGILLTSLLDLITGCVRTKWLTWNHCEAKEEKKGEGYRFVSNFVYRFVFLPFFFSKKKTKQTGCIIMYLHSASRLTGTFTLYVCISKCVWMRARACVCACVSCTHVRALIHEFDHCGCMCSPVSVYPAHMRHGCEQPGMYEFMHVSVFWTYSWD